MHEHTQNAYVWNLVCNAALCSSTLKRDTKTKEKAFTKLCCLGTLRFLIQWQWRIKGETSQNFVRVHIFQQQ